jgi:uncharacterized protein (DUF2141 family)
MTMELISKSLISIVISMTSSLVLAIDLNLEITNIENDRGQILVWIFDQAHADEFPKDGTKAACVHRSNATSNSEQLVAFQCPELVEGNYAIMVIHDSNSNERIFVKILATAPTSSAKIL